MCLCRLRCVLVFAMLASVAHAAEPTPEVSQTVDLVLEVADLVLERHVDPPARQQMLLDAVRMLHQFVERPLPGGMGRRVSALANRDEERAFLIDVVQSVPAPTAQDLEMALLQGVLDNVRGGSTFIPAKDAAVQDQLRGNRYVGIGIRLSAANEGRGPGIVHPFPQGVAYQAGIRNDDQIIEVDGVSTDQKNLADIVAMLRGPEGSTVRLLIRRANEAAPMSFNLRRSVVRFETVLGYKKNKDGVWDYRAVDSQTIGYAQISEIRASTVQELRQVEQRLRSLQSTGLVLDLRHNDGGNFHDAVLVADALLPEGMIGKVRSPQRESEFKSGPDCLFRDWPLVVLIDSNTSQEAEWLAAALKDTRQAVLIGTPTPGEGYSTEPVALPSGRGNVELWTKVLLRADGSTLLHRHSNFLNYVKGWNPTPAVRSRISKQGIGVSPDIEVHADGERLSQWMESRRTPTEETLRQPPTDPQLQAAVRHLSKE